MVIAIVTRQYRFGGSRRLENTVRRSAVLLQLLSDRIDKIRKQRRSASLPMSARSVVGVPGGFRMISKADSRNVPVHRYIARDHDNFGWVVLAAPYDSVGLSFQGCRDCPPSEIVGQAKTLVTNCGRGQDSMMVGCQCSDLVPLVIGRHLRMMIRTSGTFRFRPCQLLTGAGDESLCLIDPG